MTGVHTIMKEARSQMTFYHHLFRPELGLGWPPMRQDCYKKRKFGDNNKDLNSG